MCRVLAYIGPETPLENLLLKPENSLVNQALDPERHPELQLAGWGFGIWSEHLLKPEDPLIYRRPMAAFYDDNADRIIPSLQASTMLAPRARGRLRLGGRPGRRELPPVLLRGDPLDPRPERRPAELDAPAEGAAAALRGQIPEADAGITDTEFLYVLLLSLLEGDSDEDVQRAIEDDGRAHRPGDEGSRSRSTDQVEDGPGVAEPHHRGQLRSRAPGRDRPGG